MQSVKLKTLSEYMGGDTKPIDDVAFPAVGEKDADIFGSNLLEVMQFVFNHTTFDPDNEIDQKLLAAYEPLGVAPGKVYHPGKVAKLDGQRVRQVAERIFSEEIARPQDPAFSEKAVTGLFQPKGKIGLDLLLFQSISGPIGVPADEAVYPAIITSDGKPMTADNDYVIRMTADELPPAGAFWSLTLYDTANGFFMPNERKKYSVGENGGNAAEIAPIPSFFYVRPLSERLRFGLSSTAPLGGGVDYGSDFVGRYAIRDVTLAGLALTPALAYRVTDKLSLGAGISLLYTTLDQSIAIRRGAPDPALDARVKFEDLDDWGVQAVLGLTYALSDRLLLGIVYRSEADTDLEGDVKFEGLRNPQLLAALPRDVKISWTNPQWLEAGLRYRMDDKTQLYFNVGWQEWSKFSDNELSFRNDQVQVLDRNWDDTWHAGIAAVRVLSPNSLVSIGLAYESSPVKDEYRTLDFPVDEQWKLSAAHGWKHSDDMSFSVGGTLSFVGDAALEQTAQQVKVRGDYDTNFLAVVGGTFRYDF
jgi:long-subunit fatty acid transport protein